MNLKTVKIVSLVLALIPLGCLFLYSKTNNSLFVVPAILSVVGQLSVRRSFWKCPDCKNPMPPTVVDQCPYCGQHLDI